MSWPWPCDSKILSVDVFAEYGSHHYDLAILTAPNAHRLVLAGSKHEIFDGVFLNLASKKRSTKK